MFTAETLASVLKLEETMGGFGSLNPDKFPRRRSLPEKRGPILKPAADGEGIGVRQDPKTGEWLPTY